MNIDQSGDTQPTREVFIVRLWKNEATQVDWTGQIHHVTSGDVTAIRDLENLLEFFKHQLGQPADKPKREGKLK